MPRGILNSYRIAWIVVILLFGTAIWWFALRSPEARRHAGSVSSEQVKLLRDTELEPEETKPGSLEDSAPKDIQVDNADVVIVGQEGDVEMRLWVKTGTRDGSTFKLIEGTMQFLLKDKRTLLLRITDGSFASEEGRVRVEGSITGNVDGTSQYFEARQLVWSEHSNQVETHSVRYIGPYVDVTGDNMIIDVETGQVFFDGPVTAGI